jgi:hypothetical protein
VKNEVQYLDIGNAIAVRHRRGKGLLDWIEIEDLNTIFR